ncbi:hypothetical protein F5Y02DRAFT_387325 [Annulohypoxylon stygium]|nr:hypothetical protein F5Y02DRAFT_387325 [Annulohypoxylon stygium]
MLRRPSVFPSTSIFLLSHFHQTYSALFRGTTFRGRKSISWSVSLPSVPLRESRISPTGNFLSLPIPLRLTPSRFLSSFIREYIGVANYMAHL